jgi:hypothetical protein
VLFKWAPKQKMLIFAKTAIMILVTFQGIIKTIFPNKSA